MFILILSKTLFCFSKKIRLIILLGESCQIIGEKVLLMNDVKKYLQTYGNITIDKMPLNDIDFCLLTQLSYLKFDQVVGKLSDHLEPISLNKLNLELNEDKLFVCNSFTKNNRELFYGLRESKRFAHLKINYVANIISEYMKTQFSAITCFLEEYGTIVIFRGTDDHLVGWYEDFRIAFKTPTCGQVLSTLYLEEVVKRVGGKIFLCGHSKGGNFATFAATYVSPDVQEHIQQIYNFDSPGLHPSLLKNEGYENISKKIIKIVPSSAMIGMFLYNGEPYITVKSSAFGILQHNPYSWRIKGTYFNTRNNIGRRQNFFNQVFNRWILEATEEELLVFVDTLFQVLYGIGIKKLMEFRGKRFYYFIRIKAEIKKIEGTKKQNIVQFSKRYFTSLFMECKSLAILKKYKKKTVDYRLMYHINKE